MKLQILKPESELRFNKTTKLYMGDCYVTPKCPVNILKLFRALEQGEDDWTIRFVCCSDKKKRKRRKKERVERTSLALENSVSL